MSAGALPWIIGGAALLWALRDDVDEGLEAAIEPTKQDTKRRYLVAELFGKQFITGHVAPGESTAGMRAQMNQLLEALGRQKVQVWNDLDAVADTPVRVILARHPVVTDGHWMIVMGLEDSKAAAAALTEIQKSLPGFEFRTMDDYWPAEILTGMTAPVSGDPEEVGIRGLVTALMPIGV